MSIYICDSLIDFSDGTYNIEIRTLDEVQQILQNNEYKSYIELTATYEIFKQIFKVDMPRQPKDKREKLEEGDEALICTYEQFQGPIQSVDTSSEEIVINTGVRIRPNFLLIKKLKPGEHPESGITFRQS